MSGSAAGAESWRMNSTRMTQRAGVRFHGPRPRRADSFSFLTKLRLVRGYVWQGAKQVMRGLPVTVALVAAVCGKPGRAFWAARSGGAVRW